MGGADGCKGRRRPLFCNILFSEQLLESKNAAKFLTFSILHASPKAYRIFRKVFNMPSIKTLQRCMQKVQIHPGFPQALLDAFKWKVRSMSPLSKKYALIFDKITIKENVSYNSEKDFVEGFEDFAFGGRSKYVANHATVFMVRGLETKWKQPLSYFYLVGLSNQQC